MFIMQCRKNIKVEIRQKQIMGIASEANFSLVTHYSLKFTCCSLLVVKSLVTRCKIRSLLVAEVARCKKSLVTRCKIRLLLVAKIHSSLVMKKTRELMFI